MKHYNQKKDHLTRILDFIIYVLDYIYKEMTVIPKDLITEIHLRYFRFNKNSKKKILGYWDFNQRVSKLGDFLCFLEYLSYLQQELKPGGERERAIDLCFIDDATHYNATMSKFQKSYQYKQLFASLVVTNSLVDSVFWFRSNREFERFYRSNRTRYIRWPPTVSGTFLFNPEKLEELFQKNKSIPQLGLPSEILAKAYSFYGAHLGSSLPIIVNIRHNLSHANYRNSNIQEWQRFFRHYELDPRYRFIIICNREEILEDLRNMNNVLFSKDYFSTLEEDLALIKTSYLSIFPSSGMACFAWYSNVPFLQHGPHGRDHITVPKDGKSFQFFQEYQRQCYDQTGTSEWLISAFDSLRDYLEEQGINNFQRIKETINREAKINKNPYRKRWGIFKV